MSEEFTMPESLASETIVEVPEWEPLEIPDNEALQFVSDLKLGWSLGNTFDASDCSVSDELDYESAWVGIKTTQENIQTIAQAGFKTLRIPVSWHNHLVDENYLISETWLNRVQEVIDWAIAEDMYVILNIHHDNNLECLYPDYEHLDQSIEYVSVIWEQLAARFADYDEHLIFETCNEPRLKDTDNEWNINVNSDLGKEAIDCINQINQAAVDAIRNDGTGYNDSRYIMVPSYCASAEYALASTFTLPTDSKADNRILVSVHAYTPYNFALAAEGDSGATNDFSISEQNGIADIDSFMEKLYDKYVSQGIGVVIGEFGARAKGDNLEARTEYAAYYVARAKYYGMTACWWDNHAFTGDGENLGLLRRLPNKFMFPEIVAQMVYYANN